MGSGIGYSGIHKVFWDAKNESGEKVSSGVYLYQLETKSGIISKKMMLMK